MNADRRPNLETARLRLRPVAGEDYADLCALFGDPAVMRYINHGVGRTVEETRAHTERMVQHWEEHGFGMWALHHKADGEFVGRCGFRFLDDTALVELGYTLHQRFWGQGLAVEAGRACLEYAFQHLEHDRIVAITLEENLASRRVMEKLGFQFEGPAHYYKTDVVLYALRKADWRAAHAV
jgi:ribosomal-protein-alanine N-acetyltransferase